MEYLRKSWGVFLIASLTLGLAPFKPEPHIIGKLKWVAGGANGMQLIDWADLAMHGLPWLLLIISALLNLKSLIKSRG